MSGHNQHKRDAAPPRAAPTPTAPLAGLRAIELAGLAPGTCASCVHPLPHTPQVYRSNIKKTKTQPGPFAGLLLSDYGCTVLRIDRPRAGETPTPPTADPLTRGKSSLTLDLSDPAGRTLLLALLPSIDILIDPYRPGVLERLDLSPETVLLASNPRLVVARLTGFPPAIAPADPEAAYAHMAGHDLNYLATSGVLSTLGPPHPHRPAPPGNILADFAGGGAPLFAGILLALLRRTTSGRGGVVHGNMVDSVRYLGSFARAGLRGVGWERGTGVLDGWDCPFYRCYAVRDGYVSVAAVEGRFYDELVRLLGVRGRVRGLNRWDRGDWGELTGVFQGEFARRTREGWMRVFLGSDACVAPVKSWGELEAEGVRVGGAGSYVRIGGSGAVGVGGSGPVGTRGSNAAPSAGAAETGADANQREGLVPLVPGEGGEEVLRRWTGWRRGREFEVSGGGVVWAGGGGGGGGEDGGNGSEVNPRRKAKL